jgi:hypothetical protein
VCIFFFITDFHKCGIQNNTNVHSIFSVRKECLVPFKKEGMKNNNGTNTDACEEYHVALEKKRGILGLHIEVCISQRNILDSIIIL